MLLFKITEWWKWWVVVVDEENKVLGVFTDWDLRRFIQKNGIDFIEKVKIKDVMTKNPKVASITQKAVNVLNVMEANNITFIPIVDEKRKLLWAINIHDIVKEWIK